MTCLCDSSTVPELKRLVVDYLRSYKKDNSAVPQLQDRKRTMNGLITKFKSDIQLDSIKKNDIISDGIDSPQKDCIGCRRGSVFTEMKKEINRVESFKDRWPLQRVKPSDLASAGLFYLGIADRVQCAFCHGIITDWSEGDDPLEEHITHFPMCPLLLGKEVGNVPIHGSSGFCSMHSFESNSSGHVSRDAVNSIPKYPELNNVDKRLRTYAGWSPLHICSPEMLAECGLFYTGTADIVTCFCCGGSLGHWERGDDPWVEHAKHFPKCAYVNYIKGSSFVQSVLRSVAQPIYSDCIGIDQRACFHSGSASNVTEKVNDGEASASAGTSSNGEQQNKYLCKICMEEKPRVAFIPCGHSLACPNCAKQLSACPVCRSVIESTVRIYFD